MGYAEQLLGDNEQIVFKTRQHGFVICDDALVDGLLVALFITIAIIYSAWTLLAIPLPLLHFSWKYMGWKSSSCFVTTRRVIVVEGILNKKSVDSSLEKINDVKLVQSLWGRLWNYGTIDILTASEEGVNHLAYIHNPVEFKKAMLNQKEAKGVAPAPAPTPASAAAPSANPLPPAGEVTRLIEELDNLRKKGLLTDDEFNAKKRDLLARL